MTTSPWSYIERMGDVWPRVQIEIAVGGAQVIDLKHLALAILLDEAVISALPGVEWPNAERLRRGLLGEVHEVTPEVIRVGDNILELGPKTTWEVDSRVTQCLEEVLGDNDLSGLHANVSILSRLLDDFSIRSSLDGAGVDTGELQRLIGRLGHAN